jgi:NAD(P)-dependent dehydrogenase (short-subunit alcohol dehydrogenase family)
MIWKQAVWFITRSSRGLGRVLASEILSAGYHVSATARRTEDIRDLAETHGDRCLALLLDVANRQQVSDSIAEAESRFGRIDVLVNDAGYGYLSAIEEGEDAGVQCMFKTVLFAPVALIKDVMPRMRRRKDGHIVNVSSIDGLVNFPGVGYHNMAKAGVEAMSDVLAREVAPFNIGVTVVAPGAFRTDFRIRDSMVRSATTIADYSETVGKARAGTAAGHGKKPGDHCRRGGGKAARASPSRQATSLVCFAPSLMNCGGRPTRVRS